MTATSSSERVRIPFRCTPELRAAIERRRGDVSLNIYLTRLVEADLGMHPGWTPGVQQGGGSPAAASSDDSSPGVVPSPPFDAQPSDPVADPQPELAEEPAPEPALEPEPVVDPQPLKAPPRRRPPRSAEQWGR
jgi:hypothetical protein